MNSWSRILSSGNFYETTGEPPDEAVDKAVKYSESSAEDFQS